MHFFDRHEPRALAVFRIVMSLVFMQHGFQKLLGWPYSAHHPDPVPLLSFIGFAGLLEVFGGILFAVGWFTRPVAFILSGEMAVAYFLAYFPKAWSIKDGWMPVVNGGELAVMFCFAFLWFSFHGAGPISVDALLRKRRAIEGA